MTEGTVDYQSKSIVSAKFVKSHDTETQKATQLNSVNLLNIRVAAVISADHPFNMHYIRETVPGEGRKCGLCTVFFFLKKVI